MTTSPRGRLFVALTVMQGFGTHDALRVVGYADSAPNNLDRVARLMPMLSGTPEERADAASKLLREAGYYEGGAE